MNEQVEKYLKEFASEAESWFNANSWLEENFNFFRSFFQQENLDKSQWTDFQEMGNHLHAFNALAIAKKNALGKPNLEIEEYRKIFSYIHYGTDSVDVLINNLFKKYDGKYSLPRFGESSISELIVYSHPGKYIVYNRRDIAAIKSLGIEFQEARGETFGASFKRYNEILEPVVAMYEKVVGKRTNTTLQLELDQFFSWVYTRIKETEITFPQLIEDFKELIAVDESVLKEFSFLKTNKDYVWIVDKDKIIGNSQAHYEISLVNNVLYVELHFEGTQNQNDRFYKELTGLAENVEWFKWYKSKSLSISEKIYPDSTNFLEQLRDALLYLEENVGDKVRAVLSESNSHEKYWLFAPGRIASKWEEFYNLGIMAIGWDELGDLSKFATKELLTQQLQKIEDTEGSKKNDATACWEFLTVMKEGDIVIAKKGNTEYIGWGVVSSKHFFDEKRTEYRNCRKVKWITRGIWIEEKGPIVVKTLTEISKYPDYVNRLKSLLKIGMVDKDIETEMSLNQILFGPPGTGKTYSTINKALEIFREDIEELTRNEIKTRFDKLMEEGRIVFTTFHQSMCYEDFIEGIKPIEPEKEGDPVIYKIEHGILRKLCIEAAFAVGQLSESTETEAVLDFSMAYDSFVEKLEERLAKTPDVELETKAGGTVLVDSISSQGNIIIRHHNGQRSYTVSKARLTKLQSAINNLDDLNNINNQFRAIIGGSNSSAYWSVLNAIRKDAPQKQKTRETRVYTWDEKKEVVQSLRKEEYKGKKASPYVLIIDEINRGNVSQILGEIITLIEKDKRLGNDEALEVTLPYSKERFGVPPNLYIIGTMNTADRSVEALDTALRRRFSFVEMAPRYDLKQLQNEIIDGITLSDLLQRINRRIEKLLDKDHMIGHSFFLCVEDVQGLQRVFMNNIIPLLQEYFYGDIGKIALVLDTGFFEDPPKDNKDNVLATVKWYEHGEDLEERVVVHLKNIGKMDESEFESAIRKLMN